MTGFTLDVGRLDIETPLAHPVPWRKSDIAATPGRAVTSSGQLPASGNVIALCGYEFTETTGSAQAAVRLHDGTSTGGQVFVRVNLSSNESTRDFIGLNGLVCTTGEIYIEVISGSVEGVIFWR